MRQWRPIGEKNLPRNTPLVSTKLRHAAGQLYRGGVEIGEPSFGIRGVDGNRKDFHHLAEDTARNRTSPGDKGCERLHIYRHAAPVLLLSCDR